MSERGTLRGLGGVEEAHARAERLEERVKALEYRHPDQPYHFHLAGDRGLAARVTDLELNVAGLVSGSVRGFAGEEEGRLTRAEIVDRLCSLESIIGELKRLV